jgi:diguanylate cyclase (GGDEF)-like protein
MPKNGRLHWLHWLIVSLSLCLTLFAWYVSKQQVEERTQQTFNRQSQQIVSLVRERLAKYADTLWGGVAYLSAVQGEFSHKDWALYSQSLQLQKKYPGINGIGVIYAMPSSDLKRFEQIQQKTRPDFKVYPAHQEKISWPITYVAPLATNRAAVGLDMAHEANRFTAAKKAAKTGTAQMTGPIVLVQDKEKTPGFLLYVPFYDTGKTTVQQKKFIGLVYAPFIVKNLMDGAIAQRNRLVDIAISDHGESLFNEIPGSAHGQDKKERVYHKIIHQIIYGRTWSFNIVANAQFYKTTANSQPAVILTTGIVIDTLLLLLFIALARSNRKSINYANEVTKHLQKKTKALDKLAHFDALTELPNRRSFLQQLNRAITEAETNMTKVAVLFMDIDDFKFINDSYGHHIADKLLVMLSKLLSPLLEGFDCYLSRLSGDEFGLIIVDIQDVNEITQAIGSALQNVNQAIMLDAHEITPSISAGIACYPDNGTTTNDLITNADIAMYRAKQTGKNNYKIYNKSIDNQLKRNHALDGAIRDALSNNEFTLVYQPQIDIQTNKLIAAEALLRWDSAQLGPVSPEEFVPIAESNGLIVEIGKWVIERASKDLLAMKQQHSEFKHLRMAINASARELEQSNYMPYIRSVFEKYGLNPSNFEFEVTESSLMKNIMESSKTIDAIKNMGSSIALDDFGTGYSSMKYLNTLSISILKIDKFFISEISQDSDAHTIVNAMIQLAHNLGLKVLAEGVETREQLDYLKKQQCDYVQGYYFSKPLSYDDFVAWAIKY